MSFFDKESSDHHAGKFYSIHYFSVLCRKGEKLFLPIIPVSNREKQKLMNIKIDAGGNSLLPSIKIYAWQEKKFQTVDSYTEFTGNKRKL